MEYKSTFILIGIEEGGDPVAILKGSKIACHARKETLEAVRKSYTQKLRDIDEEFKPLTAAAMSMTKTAEYNEYLQERIRAKREALAKAAEQQPEYSFYTLYVL